MFKKMTFRKMLKIFLETFCEYLDNENTSPGSDIENVKKFSEEHLAYLATPRRNRIHDPRFE